VVDARDDPRAEVLLLGDLADEEVVLVVAGDRDGEVGAVDARALEDPQLGRVAVLDRVLELLLDSQVARAIALDDRDLVVLGDQLACQVPADLAGAGDDDVHAATPPAPVRTSRSRTASGRWCACPARRTTPRAPGPSLAR